MKIVPMTESNKHILAPPYPPEVFKDNDELVTRAEELENEGWVTIHDFGYYNRTRIVVNDWIAGWAKVTDFITDSEIEETYGKEVLKLVLDGEKDVNRYWDPNESWQDQYRSGKDHYYFIGIVPCKAIRKATGAAQLWSTDPFYYGMDYPDITSYYTAMYRNYYGSLRCHCWFLNEDEEDTGEEIEP